MKKNFYKYIEQTLQVGEQFPVDIKGWFVNLEDMRDPGKTKNSRFFYYYSGMLAHDMSTGTTYVWRETQTGDKDGVLDTDFHYEYRRITPLYDYTGKYFNFYPLQDTDTGIFELKSNKVFNFSIINDVVYPSVEAVEERLEEKVYPYLVYDATVGIDGDYATIYDAITDGKNNLLLISDVVETVTDTNYDLNYLKIKSTDGNKFKITFNTNSSLQPDYQKIYFDFQDIIIQYNITNANKFISTNSVLSKIIWNNLKVISIQGSFFYGIGMNNNVLNNIKFKLGNFPIRMNFDSCIFNNLSIVGGGTNCGNEGFLTFNNCKINNLQLSGIFTNVTGITSSASISLDNTIIEKITDTSTNGSVTLRNNNKISDGNVNILKQDPGSYSNNRLENITISKYLHYEPSAYVLSDMYYTNCIIESTAHNIFDSNSTYNNRRFINCRIAVDDISANDTKFITCVFDGTAPIISGNNIEFSNSAFNNGVIVTGDNNTINIGFLLNGTITVNATADKTTILNCRTLTSIVDYGTNTTLLANNLI